MRLSPRDLDKLALHNAGFLAQKRLARGVRLNHPEAVALLATQILELIRDGRSVAELMDVGRRILGRREVMDGVPEMIPEVQVEGTFPDGTKLVTLHSPIALERGDLELALYGSFLPVPAAERFERAGDDDARGPGGSARDEGLPAMTFAGTTEEAAPDDAVTPGEVLVKPGEIVLNEGRRTITITVQNKGDRPIQVGSHYPFAETNGALVFDRAAAKEMRLDIPAGTAVRFEPGEEKTVHLVAVAGAASSDAASSGTASGAGGSSAADVASSEGASA